MPSWLSKGIIMRNKSNSFIAAYVGSVLTLIGTAASAQEIVREPAVPTTSVVSRAEVKAQVLSAIADRSLLTYGEADNDAPQFDHFVSTRSRADVKAEAARAFSVQQRQPSAIRANG
jgi:hypothetical protein